MPIEIKELHIKVTVNQPSTDGSTSSANGGGTTQDEKEGLISQCIEQVIDLLNAKKER